MRIRIREYYVRIQANDADPRRIIIRQADLTWTLEDSRPGACRLCGAACPSGSRTGGSPPS